MSRLAAALLALSLAFAGCAREEDPSLPAVCGKAPIARSSINDCLIGNLSAGDLQTLGGVFLETARGLGREGDLYELGYLVGSLQRDAADPHREIVRRIEQEARPFADFAAYERGLRAGRSSG